MLAIHTYYQVVRQSGQERAEVQILRRRWGWIGQRLRKPEDNASRQALKWNPQGKRNRGRPRATWRRSTEQELKAMGKSWKELEKLARNRGKWRTLVRDLCVSHGVKGLRVISSLAFG